MINVTRQRVGARRRTRILGTSFAMAVVAWSVATTLGVGVTMPFLAAQQLPAADTVTRPLVSEEVAPLESIAPTASGSLRRNIESWRRNELRRSIALF